MTEKEKGGGTMAMAMTPWRFGRRVLPVLREWEHNPIEVIQRDMNRLFDDFFKGFGMLPLSEEEESYGVFAPQVNMMEDDKSIQVSAELPGLDENDIEISVTKDTLTIKGEKKEEREHREEETYYMERSFGRFSRVIPIPKNVDPDRAEASFKKGVLSITLPKLELEGSSHKKIPITGH
jgi:HSP20 family protein